MQSAAPVPAHRHERQIVREFARVADPCGAQRDVDEPRAVPHEVLDVFIGDEPFFQQFGAAVEHLAKNDGGELSVVQGLGCGRQVVPIGGWIQEGVAGVQEAATAAGSASAALSVSTSKPTSVTRIVCSHCADSDWSLVTTVQPSGSSLTSRRPALIMGSMVKVIPVVSSRPVPGLP